MDQETARRLLVEGGTFVFLGVPQETQFGIDMQCWNTDEDFRGIKMIPPGLHYIHYSAVNASTGDFAPRSGFFHFFDNKEFLVKMWDKKTENVSTEEVTEESVQRLKSNLLNLDRHLAPYPYDSLQKWRILTSQISEKLVAKLSPESGLIRASVDLLSTTDADRPRGVKPGCSTEGQEEKNEGSTSKDAADGEGTSGQSDAKRAKRSTQEEKENAMLPDLKPAPGMAMRFTEIPVNKYPPGSTPEEITKHYLDQTYSLDFMMAQHSEPLHVIGELQVAYLCFLIGHSLDAFEHWKNLVVLICSCDEALHKYRGVFFYFIRSMEVQISEMPEDFLADIVMNRNLIYKKLRELFRTAYVSKADGRLLTMIQRFKENISDKLQWDFNDLEAEEEDEKPVVVKLAELAE